MDAGYLALSSAGLIALGWSLVNYLRNIVNITSKPDFQAFKAQTIAYVGFVAVVWLAAQSTSFGTVQFVQGVQLQNMDWAGLTILGLILGGGGGVLHNGLGAIDNTRTTSVSPFGK